MNKITFNKLKKKDIPELLKTIKKIRLETKSHGVNLAKLSNWNKKYKFLPSKKSLIYLAKQKKKIIGYYHIPTYDFYIKNKINKIGSIQDVAVLKQFRKKNIFKKLSHFAILNSFKHLDLMYTFPNKKSIHTFLKYENFNYLTTLPFYIYPFKSINLLKTKFKFYGLSLIAKIIDFYFHLYSCKILKDEKVVLVKKLDKKIVNFLGQFSKKHEIYLRRNLKFLNWKYNSFINSPYKIVALKQKEKLKALVIVKIDKIFGCKCILVMDFAYTEIRYFKKILLNIESSKILNLKDISFILLSSLTLDKNKFGKMGFVKIPSLFVPRNLNLLFKSKSDSMNNFLKNPKSWFVTLSDWDVF